MDTLLEPNSAMPDVLAVLQPDLLTTEPHGVEMIRSSLGAQKSREIDRLLTGLSANKKLMPFEDLQKV